MSYFQQISDRCTELSNIAQKYLDTLPFVSSEECCQRIWNWASDQMDKDEQGYFIWNGKNGLAEEILDGSYLQIEPPHNGSIHYSLGWSMVAQDANSRSLLEYVEGRQTEWTKFKCLAELPE